MLESDPNSSSLRLGSSNLIWLSASFAGIWAVLRVGLSTIPGVEGAAQNAFGWPTNVLAQYSTFSAESPIGALLFTLIGVNDPRLFLLLHLVVIVFSIVMVARWASRFSHPSQRGMAIRIVILSPWAAILLVFLGSYDPFTLLGFALLLLAWSSSRTFWILLASFYLGFQHFEQSTIAVIAALTTSFALKEHLPQDFFTKKIVLASLMGLLLGKLGLTSILIVFSPNSAFGRSEYWTAEWFRMSIVTAINFGPVILLSLFAGSWALVFYVFAGLPRRQRLLLIAAFIALLVPTVLTLDHTRVFVMTSMLSLSVITIAALGGAQEISSRMRHLIEFMIWIVVPVSVWVSMDGSTYLNAMGSLDQLIIFFNQVRAM